jgi:tetratricopeptide (TPR) repeat protein
MKNWLHLPLAAAVAALVGLGTTLFSSEGRGAEARTPDASLAELRSTLAELRSEQAALAERLAKLPAPGAGAPAASRVPVQDLDQAIAEYMAKRLGEEPGRAGARGEPAPSDLEASAIADRILSGQVTGDALEALWQELRDTKRIDGVLAEIERAAELAPNNPDLANELGEAYLQKLFDVGIGPMAAAWGEKADKAFDRALVLDDTHWEARFNKAVSLSNWPEFLGKQPEAMRQFELLMEQQERAAAQPDHARTYWFLGNLYDQEGNGEKALATWKRGLERFPANETLRQKTEGR